MLAMIPHGTSAPIKKKRESEKREKVEFTVTKANV